LDSRSEDRGFDSH